MFRQFVSARTHCATTCLLAYVCVFICMQSIKSNQISYSGGPQNLNLNWCKNYELQNTLIRCAKVDFPYISMESAVFTKTTTIFHTK